MYAHQQKCLRKTRCPEHTSPSSSSWSSSHPVPILADPLSLQCPFDQWLPWVSEGYELWLFSWPDVDDVRDFMLYFHMHVYFDPMFIYFLKFHPIVYLKNCYPGYPGQSGIASHKYGSCVVAWYLWCQTKRRSNKKWSMKTMAWEMNHPKPNSPRKKLAVACSKVAGPEG